MAKEIEVRKIKVDTSEAVESMDKLDGATKEVDKSTEQLEGQLGSMPGPIGKVVTGFKALGKALKALMANPIIALITALVVGLTLLFKAFTKTQAGADKMKDAMAAVSAVVDVLTQRAAKLFKALGQIIRGNFKEGFQEMGEAVKGVGDEIREATSAAIEFEKATRALFEAETDILEINAERRKQIEELVFLTRDLTKSHEERRNAIIKAGELENAILGDNIKLQEDRITLQQQEIDNTPVQLRTREQLRALAEAEVVLIDMQTASLAKQRELKNRLNEIDNASAAQRKAVILAEEAKAAELDKLRLEKSKTESDLRKEEAELDAQFEADMAAFDLELAQDVADEKIAIDEEMTAKLIENAWKEVDAEQKAAREKIKIENTIKDVKEKAYQDGLYALTTFLGEGSKLSKGILIADATRAAIMGAIQTFQSISAIPTVGPFLAPIASAAALAAGMANVKKIASVSSPGGGGGGSAPSVSIASPSSGVDSSSLVNADQSIPSEVQITQDSSQRAAVRTYVVQSDVTAEQDIERQREREATL